MKHGARSQVELAEVLGHDRNGVVLIVAAAAAVLGASRTFMR